MRQHRKAGRTGSTNASSILSPDSDASVNGDPVMWRAGLGMLGANVDGIDSKRDSLTSEERSSGSSLHWIMQGPFTEKRQSEEVGSTAAESQAVSEQASSTDGVRERPPG